MNDIHEQNISYNSFIVRLYRNSSTGLHYLTVIYQSVNDAKKNATKETG